MAIYHFSAKVLSRSSGKSIVAAAAYRTGLRLKDQRTGLTHDYRRKTGVVFREIMAPLHAPDWAKSRPALWNRVEAAETRKDAQLAREVEIALPRELNRQEQIELTRDYIKTHFVSRGMVADLAIHHGKDDKPHAHILLTLRPLDGDEFARKKERAWNSKELLQDWREKWGLLANCALERAGRVERIDHRSYADQGINREPQPKLGPAAAAMERKGKRSERGNLAREVQRRNQERGQTPDEQARKHARWQETEQRLAAARQRQQARERARGYGWEDEQEWER